MDMNIFKFAFDFMENTRIGGLTLTMWCVIILLISVVGLFIRGNK